MKKDTVTYKEGEGEKAQKTAQKQQVKQNSHPHKKKSMPTQKNQTWKRKLQKQKERRSLFTIEEKNTVGEQYLIHKTRVQGHTNT